MSYLTRYLARRRAPLREDRPAARVDARVQLNRPEFDGGAHVRIFVEDTSTHPIGRRPLPSPRLKLRITDCSNRIHLDFSLDTPELRENSLHKVETLIAALTEFRDGLAAEAELRAARGQSGHEAPLGRLGRAVTGTHAHRAP